MRTTIEIPDLTEAEVKRFWKKVDRSSRDGCWLWAGYTMPNGYGQVGFRYKVYLAHRVAWKLKTGNDPGDKQVCHHCDNPSCVRYDHLFLGTQLDNVRDMIDKGREDHSKNNRGENVGTAKLTREQVKEIWRLHLVEGIGERKLGKRFDVTPANIHAILSGKTWKHLTPKDPTPLVRPKFGFPRTYPTDGSYEYEWHEAIKLIKGLDEV